KDIWMQTPESPERDERLIHARNAYLTAYRNSGGYWSGINAATLSLLAGSQQDAQQLAIELETQCNQILTNNGYSQHDIYWLWATMGEIMLILQRFDAAAVYYQNAASAGCGRYADLASTRRQARLIL